MRGGYQDWEPRQPIHPFARYDDNRRYVEELGTSDEDDGQGVHLDGYNGAVALTASGRQYPTHADGTFASDELYFTGYDLNQARQGYGYDGQGLGEIDQYQDNNNDYYHLQPPRRVPYHIEMEDKDEALVQSALSQIAKAKARGDTSVDLSEEEIAALERRRRAPQATSSNSSPSTPTSSKHGKTPTSRSASNTSLSSQKGRKKASSSGTSSPSATPTNKSNSKAKLMARKPTRQEQQQQYLATPSSSSPVPIGTPGIMVEGPDGVPVFQPIGSIPNPSPDTLRRPTGAPAEHYGQWPPRYYAGGTTGRPAASSSHGSPSSTRSISNEQYQDRHAVVPARRIVSNEADYYSGHYNPTNAKNGSSSGSGVYSSLRRVPAGLGGPASAPHRQGQRIPVENGSGSTEDDEDEEGFEVIASPGRRTNTGGDGYTGHRSPLSGGGGKRRKGWVRR